MYGNGDLKRLNEKPGNSYLKDYDVGEGYSLFFNNEGGEERRRTDLRHKTQFDTK